MKITCLSSNARIRYIRKNTAGKYDTSLPLTNLTQNVDKGAILFVELDSKDIMEKSDGTSEYRGVSLNIELFHFRKIVHFFVCISGL